jgi:hypothetical protein
MPTFNQWKEDFRDLLLVPSITSLVGERVFYGHLATLQTDPGIAQRQGGPASFPFPFPAITLQIMEGRESVFVHQFFPVMLGVHSNLHFDEAHIIMGVVFDIMKNACPYTKKFTVRADQTEFDTYDKESRLYNVFKQVRINRIGVQS